jgi:hypothetical protein
VVIRPETQSDWAVYRLDAATQDEPANVLIELRWTEPSGITDRFCLFLDHEAPQQDGLDQVIAAIEANKSSPRLDQETL